MAVAGDLRQAFLQVRIREEDRDATRFHWLRDLESKEVETLRFTRALFGMSTSPFLLGGVIEQHLNNLQHKYPDTVEEIRGSLYVDDLISGDKTIAPAQHLKEMSQPSSERQNSSYINGTLMSLSWSSQNIERKDQKNSRVLKDAKPKPTPKTSWV